MSDFFELAGPEVGRGGVPRDRAGNALLLPPGGKIRAAYTAASSLADHLTTSAHIHRWEMRYLAKGLGRNEDLAALAASETYTTGFDMEDKGQNKASGRRLDDIIVRALDRVGVHERADYGTAVHGFTEPGNDEPVPRRMRADVDSFWKTIKDEGMEIIATETFVANDDVMAAGTFDHLVRVPGLGTLIADKKTGRNTSNDFAVQLSVYSYGEIYDVETDRRSLFIDLAPDFTPSLGLIFWIKGGKTKTKIVNLDAGREAARLAAGVRDWPKVTGIMADYKRQR